MRSSAARIGALLPALGAALASCGPAAPAVERPRAGTARRALPQKDRHGDPLPPGASARFGVLRLTHPGAHRVALAADGRLLVTAAKRELRVWRARSGALAAKARLPGIFIDALLLSADGAQLLVSSMASYRSCEVALLDTATLRRRSVAWRGRCNHPGRLSAARDLSVVAATRHRGKLPEVLLWSRANKKITLRLPGHESPELSADGAQLLTRHDGALWLHDLARGKPPRRLPITPAPSGYAFDGRRLAFFAGQEVIVLPLATPQQRRRFVVAGRLVGGPELLNSGRLLAALTKDAGGRHTVHRWDLRSGRPLAATRIARPYDLAFSDSGALLATIGRTRASEMAPELSTALLLQLARGGAPRAFGRHALPIHDLALSRDGELLATASADRTVRIWHARSGKALQVLGGAPYPLTSIAFAGRRRVVAVASLAGRRGRVVKRPLLLTWDDVSARAAAPRRRALTPACPQLLGPRGRLLARLPRPGVVELGRRARGTRWRAYRLAGKVHGLAWTPAGDLLAALGGKTLLVAATAAGDERCARALPAALEHVALSADGRFVAAAAFHGIWVGRLPRCFKVRHFRGVKPRIRALALSADGRLVAAGADDGALWLGDVATAELRRLSAHLGTITRLVFAPDGRTLFSASADATALRWDLPALRRALAAGKGAPRAR